MIEVELLPYLAYYTEDEDFYHFKLDFVDYPRIDLLGGIPDNIRDAFLDLAKRLIFAAWDLADHVPREYPAGSTFPIHGQEWINSHTISVDCEFSHLKMIPYIDLDTYSDFSLFAGLLPLCMEAGDCFYAKGELPPVPDSIAGTVKLPPGASGATVFTPEKGNYNLVYPIAGRRWKSVYYTEGWLPWFFIYESIDPNTEHIAKDWNGYDYLNNKVIRDNQGISIFPSYTIQWWEDRPTKKIAGWNVWKESYTGWYDVFLEGYYCPDPPWEYYPTREHSDTPTDSPKPFPGDEMEILEVGGSPLPLDEGMEKLIIDEIEIRVNGFYPVLDGA